MSVFKKLVGFLFEEEEEIEEEGALGEVSIHETNRPYAFEEERVQGKHAPVSPHEYKAQPQVEMNVEALPVQRSRQEKKFTTIDADQGVKPKPIKQRPIQRSEKRIVKRSEPVKKEFEFTPVISPIFGMDEQNEPKPKHSAQNSLPPLRTTISTAPRKNPLGTILSPMYGATELEAFEEEAKERLEVSELMSEEPYDAFLPSDELSYDDELPDEDLIKMPLEELLGGVESTTDTDDLLQFSLFGDDEIVSTDLHDASYTIKE